MNGFTKKAKWIGSGEGGFAIGEVSPATELRRTIRLENLPSEAECLILGLGAYRLFINGKRVGTDVLSPAFTAYDKRALYMRYDVTKYLKVGINSICVKLGDGFYNQTVGNDWNFQLASWRSNPKLLFELFIDGESALASDVEWKYRRTGATVHNCIRTGEWYDARLEDGWREPEYCDTGWAQAIAVSSPGGVIEEQLMPPQREREVITAKRIWRSERGWIFDFGVTIAGYVSISCSAKAGTTLTLRYSDLLSGKELDLSQLEYCVWPNKNYATDIYTFRGEGVESWHPEFVYYGFRYVEFIWDGDEPPIDAIKAHFIHTDLKKKGNFSCSDDLLSWIYEAGIRAFLSNYQGLPLDCPHREKNGWTGDAVISADYAAFTYDMKEAYLKWMKDIADAQRPSGQIPGIVPSCGWGFNWGAGPAWDFVIFALPYVLYLETGDTDCLTETAPTVARYLEYAESREDSDGLVCYGLSDWCPPRRIGELNIMPNRFSDSCYYYAMHAIAAKAHEISGDGELRTHHAKKAAKIKAKIKEIYATDEAIASHGQGALAFLLYFKIVEGDEARQIAKRLAQLVKDDGYVHKVGILGMKALPNALSEYGYTNVAYKMLTRTDYPSYGYWRSIGEATLCEVWEENQSRNHHMYSDPVNWMTRYICGLKNCGVAYDKVELAPFFFAKECSAEAHTETPRGKISFSWRLLGGKLHAKIELPEGCCATLILGGKRLPVSSGSYDFTVE